MRQISYLFVLLLIFCLQDSYGQVPQLEWGQHHGTNIDDHGHDIHYDKRGYIYTTGRRNDQIFIRKSRHDGTTVWSRIIGNGIREAQGRGITTDQLGNIYVTGDFNRHIDFGNQHTLTAPGSTWDHDAFILKLDSMGTTIWAKAITGNDDQHGYTITSDQSNNIYVTGHYQDTTDFDPDTTSYIHAPYSYLGSYFLAKYDSDGNFKWMHGMPEHSGEFGHPVATDLQNNVYTVSTYQVGGNDDIRIRKRDSAGTLLWTKSIGGSEDDEAHSITVDDAGKLLITGAFQNDVDFDPSYSGTHIQSSYSRYIGLNLVFWPSIFVLKLDANGNFIWVYSDERENSKGYAIATDRNNNVYAGGRSGYNALLIKLNSNGLEHWRRTTYTSTAIYSDYAYKSGVATDSLDGVYTIGNFKGACDIDPEASHHVLNSASSTDFDFYICKWSPIPCSPASSSIDVPLCNGSYTSPSGKYTWQSSGVYQDTVWNALLCDSIITINLYDPLSLPYQEDFEGSYLPPYTSIYNYDDSITWDSIQVIGANGTATQALYVNCYDYGANNQRDYFYLPTLDFTTTQRAELTFDLSYRPYSSVYYDELGVEISTDCGNTYQRVYTKDNLTLGVGNQYHTTAWAPSSSNDWRNDAINLNAYVGHSVQIRFVVKNGYGNNLYIDNINIDTTCYPSGSNLSVNACNNYIAPDGQVYTTSGQYTAIIPNSIGCDSTIAINLTIGDSSSSTIHELACDSYTAPDGQVYTTSGQYTAIVPNSAGCDSTVTINLTIQTTASMNTTVSQNGLTLTANASGMTYQWLDCNNGNTPIVGATAQNFTPTLSGSYAVQISNGTCTSTSTCTTVSLVATENLKHGAEILVYPNPTNGIIYIHKEQEQESTIQVLDHLGRVLIEQKATATLHEINMEGFPTGLYTVSISSGQQLLFYKIVKN
ncbi:SBBP repeat-containing protein [Aureispira anguillae]|uniref:SBBP repeat-containing protein n=1 Tax=Aureispira anguillae TaxID=2864201 RepID=A0A916DWU7_9BACT|nr:SBBP repeat-containing protein [Aureispira anguillae]BDS15207.1 SBBP repeat-containing protein [Aureispira anguillae]